MSSAPESALRTRVYVDGYNLYYGCLKNTAHKWLDVRALVERILPSVLYERNGLPFLFEFRTPAIKYFTAPILSAFARSADSVACQSQYHSALRGHLGTEIEIITGYYDARPARAYAWLESKPAHVCPMVDIWKLEEKQSDVALALHAFCDAVRGDLDQIVVITNDSDFAPAMQMIRQHTRAVLGVIAPVREGERRSRVNRELDKYAHWTRTHILDEEFAASQLPAIVRLKGGAVHRPLSWYPCPELLLPIYEEAKRVRGSNGAVAQMAQRTLQASRESSAHRHVHFARERSRASRLHEEVRSGVLRLSEPLIETMIGVLPASWTLLLGRRRRIQLLNRFSWRSIA